MSRNALVLSCVVLTITVLSGCASKESGKEAKTAAIVRDKIQGKTQIMMAENTQADQALNAGGQTVYIWQDMRRYRLFLRKPAEIEAGKEYAVEGIWAQRVIDELGDPDQGKGGYPLTASCKRAVRNAWPGLSMDEADTHSLALRNRIRRFPARPVFLVTSIEPAKGEVAPAGDSDAPEITVPAEKQKALLVEGPTVFPAPLWEPAGGTIKCKLMIDTAGKVAELETGAQLCESVPWAKFKYKPTVERGKPVKVHTEVEVKFEARTGGAQT